VSGEPVESEDGESVLEKYHRGVITRVYYGSGSGTLRSRETGREYRFKGPLVEIRGPIPRVDGLREGMEVGFDLARTASGPWVSLIRVPE
jgi:hypothetical protein